MKAVLINGCFNGSYADALGIGYLASVLRQNGLEVILIDPIIEKISPEQYAKMVINYEPYLIGISVLSIKSRKDVFEFLKELRKNQINSHICVGGKDPSMSPSVYLKFGLIDSVVIGEGELTFLELAKTLKYGGGWKTISGLCYIENGNIVYKLPGKRINDPNEIPFPARDMLRLYIEKHPNHDSAQILGSRGCYSNCSFCISSTFDRLHRGKRFRLRKVSNIIEEMYYLYDNFGIKHFDFVDDLFLPPGSIGIRRAQEFKELLSKDHRKMTFNVMMRPDTVQKKVVMDLKSVGLTEIFIGVENFEDSSLTVYQKGYSSEVCERALKCLSDVGFKTTLDAKYRVRLGMLTFHAETTLDTLEVQLRAAKRWSLSPKKLKGRVIPFEGTQIRKQYEKKGLLTETEFRVGFKFQNKDVETFFRYWKPFIDRLMHLRDRIRTVEKRWKPLNISKDKNLIQGREFLDSIGFNVFEKLLEMVKKGTSESNLTSFVKSQEELYETYWRDRIRPQLEKQERLLEMREGTEDEL